MAEKKKTTKQVTENVEESTKSSEIDALKEQIKQMQKYIDDMQKPVKEEKLVQKPAKKNIKFINLCNGTLVLKGTKFWTIDGQFSSRAIPESEARVIVSNMPNLISSGMVCVPDKEFLEEYDLEDSYDGVLNDKALKTLLSKDANDIVEVYQNASDVQRKIIVDMITERQLNNQRVDANVLVEIGKLCGRDLSQIEPMED